MAQAFKLTVSGVGIASVQVSSYTASAVGQIAGALGVAGATDPLDVVLWSCPEEPSGTIPAGSQALGELKAAVSSNALLNLAPDGIDVLQYIAAQFVDADTAHAVYVYVK